jgi:hypothetical protein
MTCNCKEYEIGIKQIVGAQLNSDNHHGAPYTANKFKFCPWCGERLEEYDFPETTQRILNGTI